MLDGFELTPAGLTWLAGLGLQPDPPSSRGRHAYPCLDWSERRDHLSDQLADQIHQRFSAKRWVRRGSGREVVLTAAGRRDLLALLPILQAAESS